MNRFVLAFLALLAGLVSQTAPAHARYAGASGAEVTVQLPGSDQVAVSAARSGSRPQVAQNWRAEPDLRSASRWAYRPATVEIGSDRSRQ